jgi:hypothetical protein
MMMMTIHSCCIFYPVAVVEQLDPNYYCIFYHIAVVEQALDPNYYCIFDPVAVEEALDPNYCMDSPSYTSYSVAIFALASILVFLYYNIFYISFLSSIRHCSFFYQSFNNIIQ